MNDLGLAAATMAQHRAGDVSRYDGWVALSALPDAPVVHERAPRRRRLVWGSGAARRKAARTAARRSSAPAGECWCGGQPSGPALSA